MPNYQRLRVWQAAVEIGAETEEAVRSLPSGYAGLRDQLRRAVMSVPNNIAEGSDRGSDKEFARYLRIALSSAAEAESLIQYAVRLRALHHVRGGRLAERLGLLRRMLRTLISVVEGRSGDSAA